MSATQSVDYNLTVTANDIFGLWFCDWKPIDVSATYSSTTSTGVSFDVGPGITVGYRTWVEAVDTYRLHTGTVDRWDAGGYAGVASYTVKEPASPFCTLRLRWPAEL